MNHRNDGERERPSRRWVAVSVLVAILVGVAAYASIRWWRDDRMYHTPTPIDDSHFGRQD